MNRDPSISDSWEDLENFDSEGKSLVWVVYWKQVNAALERERRKVGN